MEFRLRRSMDGALKAFVRTRLNVGLALLGIGFTAFTVIPAVTALLAADAGESARADQVIFRQLRVDAETLSAGLLEVQAAARGYAATGQPGYVDRAEAGIERLGEDLERLRRDFEVAEVEPVLAGRVLSSMERYLDIQRPSVATLGERTPREIRARIATGEGQELIDRTRDRLARANARFAERAAESSERADTYFDRLRAANLVAIIGTFFTILAAFLYVLLALQRPLRRLDGAAGELGRGNESTRVEPEGAAEVATLGRAFNEMAERLQQRQVELLAASRAKSDFLARVSHELRTPLNAILGFGQLLEMDDLDEQSADSVRQILRAGHHLLDLIDEVLDISRIESDSLRISMEPVPVLGVFGDVQSMIAPLAMEREITLRVGEVDPGLHVLCDQQRLKQILLNLLSNAVKYNHRGGEIEVSAELKGDEVEILVADGGIGISPSDQERLFTPFERLDAEREGHAEGTGLGLALSERLARLMGGSLRLKESDESGSTFALSMRRADRMPQPEALPDGPRPRRRRDGELLVVCIEDNNANFELVERILEDYGPTRIHAAIQGTIGLDLIRQHKPDLVLLDLHLPDISGEEVLSRLKSDPETRDVPVIIMSADATTGHRNRLIEAGAICYLTKPLDVREFLDQVERAVESASEAPNA